MPSVSFRKSGSRWHIRFREKGRKEVVKSFPGSLQERTVQKKAAWYDEQWSLDRFDPYNDQQGDSHVLVRDAIDDYCQENLASGNWSKATYERALNCISRSLESVLNRRVSGLTQHLVEDSIGELSVSAITKKGYLAKTNTFLKRLHESDIIRDQIQCSLEVTEKLAIRNDSKIKYLIWQQLDHVCSAMQFIGRQNHHLYRSDDIASFYVDMWWFMFYSLLRKNEVSRLTNRDVIGEAERIRVHGKGRKVDEIPLPAPAADLIRKYWDSRDPDGPVFSSHMNRSYKHFRQAVCLALGEDHPSGFHQLRHGGVVHYLTLGKPIQFVSKLCRHANIQVTLQVYANVNPDGLAAAFSDVSHGPATQRK
ncbi:MAG: site-specific integrase [Balneolaceae bacterium]